MTPAALIKKFNKKYPGLVEKLTRDRCYLGIDVGVEELKILRKYRIGLVYSNGCPYHSDAYGQQFTNILVLHDPGYRFQRKRPEGGLEIHRKKFFSFVLEDWHGLFWDKEPRSKRRRENWVALVIDNNTRQLNWHDFSNLINNFLEGKCLTKVHL